MKWNKCAVSKQRYVEWALFWRYGLLAHEILGTTSVLPRQQFQHLLSYCNSLTLSELHLLAFLQRIRRLIRLSYLSSKHETTGSTRKPLAIVLPKWQMEPSYLQPTLVPNDYASRTDSRWSKVTKVHVKHILAIRHYMLNLLLSALAILLHGYMVTL